MRDADATARELFEGLFQSETLDDMQYGFDALRAEMDWRREEHERAEREAMKNARKKGRARPRPTKRVSQRELDAAVAEWGPAPAPAGDPDQAPV